MTPYSRLEELNFCKADFRIYFYANASMQLHHNAFFTDKQNNHTQNVSIAVWLNSRM
jgi:hypothetical protein